MPALPARRDGTLDNFGGSAPLAGEDAIGPGATIGDYIVREVLGGGGHGDVYRADHIVLGRRVALKVLHHELAHSPEMLERFEREARAANLIRHPSIVDVIGFGQMLDGRPYFVMEFLDGDTLYELVERHGRLSLEDALRYFEAVAAALDAAHAIGIVHRDVKLSNIMVGPAGIKLLDFGIAKFPEPRVSGATATGQRVGTSISMSPEQIRGEAIDLRADLYALGVLLHHMVTGRPPFHADLPVEIERMHLEVPPPPPSRLAPAARAIDAVVQRAMAKAPADRYASVKDMLAALRAAVAGGAVEPPPVRAVGIYVAIGAPGRPIDEPDLERADEVLAVSERTLRGAGFVIVVGEASALFAVRPDREDGGDRSDRETVVDLAGRIDDAVRRKLPRLPVTTALHVDAIELVGARALGGALLAVDRWVPFGHDGLFATAAYVEGLPAAGSSPAAGLPHHRAVTPRRGPHS
jgi:serine/threonine-protein kinase